MKRRKFVEESDEENESDGFEIIGDPSDHPLSFQIKPEPRVVDLTKDDSHSDTHLEDNVNRRLDYKSARIALEHIWSGVDSDEEETGDSKSKGKKPGKKATRMGGSRNGDGSDDEGQARRGDRRLGWSRIEQASPSQSECESPPCPKRTKKRYKPEYRNSRRITSPTPSPPPSDPTPSPPPRRCGTGQGQASGSSTVKRKRDHYSSPSSPSSRTPRSRSTSSSSLSCISSREPSPSSSSSSTRSSASPSSSRSSSSSSSSNSDLDYIDREDRMKATGRQLTPGMIWLKKHVHLRRKPKIAIVRPNIIIHALATSKDMLNLPALEHVDLIHTIRDRLRRQLYPDNSIVWPVGAGVRILKYKEIPQVRAIMKQLQTAQGNDGPAIVRPIRPCRVCSSGIHIGQFRAQCVSDYTAREGCLVCIALKKQGKCSERMSSKNRLFVHSPLDVVRDERAAGIVRSAEIEKLIELANSLTPYLETRNRVPPTPVNEILRDFMRAILRRGGLEETEVNLFAARAGVGAENDTRSTDNAGARLRRALDGRKKLSWSTREVIEEEETAWNNSENALISVSAIKDKLVRQCNQEAGAFHPWYQLIAQIVAIFAVGSPLSIAEGDMRKARQNLGKPRR